MSSLVASSKYGIVHDWFEATENIGRVHDCFEVWLDWDHESESCQLMIRDGYSGPHIT
jgi:hypothetical protein